MNIPNRRDDAMQHQTRKTPRGTADGTADAGATTPTATNDFERAVAFLRKVLADAKLPRDHGIRFSAEFLEDVQRALTILTKWEDDDQTKESRKRQRHVQEMRRRR